MTLYDWLLDYFFPLFINVDKLNVNIPFVNAPLVDIFTVTFVLFLSIVICLVFIVAPYKLFIRLCKGPNKRGK